MNEKLWELLVFILVMWEDKDVIMDQIWKVNTKV